jgi:serine/threonine protein phosphatase PrpC
MHFARFIRAHEAEQICGDAIRVISKENLHTVAVIDGLGHGREANRAAQAADETVRELATQPPSLILKGCHQALQGTRGAAIGIMQLKDCQGSFAGVGNVEVRAKSRKPIKIISFPGIVGHNIRKIQEFEFIYNPGDLICMFSDGIGSRISLDEVDPKNLEESAQQLGLSYGRNYDDASLVLILC